MKEYQENKKNIVALLKSPDKKNVLLGIELFHSQLKMSHLETIFFVIDNNLCPRRKLDRLHCMVFDSLGFQYRNSRPRYSRQMKCRDSLEMLWEHPVTKSTLELDLKTIRGNRLYPIDSGQSILEYCLVDTDMITYKTPFKF